MNITTYTIKTPCGLLSAAQRHVKLLGESHNVTDIESIEETDLINTDVIYFHGSLLRNTAAYVKNKHSVAYRVVEGTECNFGRVQEELTQLWTASECSAKALYNKFNVPVYVVPHPIETITEPNDLDIHDKFCFLTCAAQNMNRKNVTGVIKAFKLAFPKNKDVCLVVKLRLVSVVDRTIISEIIGNDSRISLVDGDISNLTELYRSANCYVQMQRAGAFELHCAEAASYGIPVITTGYGGPVEYLPKESLIQCNLVPSTDKRIEGSWAEPDMDSAVDKLREVYNNFSFRKSLAYSCRALVTKHCNPDRIRFLQDSHLKEVEALPPKKDITSLSLPVRLDKVFGRKNRIYTFRLTQDLSSSPYNKNYIERGVELVGRKPLRDKIPMILSHRRSGTHHLGEFININWETPWLKSHDFPEVIKDFNNTYPIYIIRNPIACLHSTYHWFAGGGSSNAKISEYLNGVSFNQWLAGKAGKLFSFDTVSDDNRDNLYIGRGAFYDPIAYWVSHATAYLNSEVLVVDHSKLISDPATIANSIESILGVREQEKLKLVDRNVALAPSLIGSEEKLSSWSVKNLGRLREASGEIVEKLGYSSLEDWLLSCNS